MINRKASSPDVLPENAGVINLGAIALIVFALLLAMFRPVVPDALMRPPDFMVLPFQDWINWAFTFVKDDLGFIHVTRAFASAVEWGLDITANLFYGRNRWPYLGPIPWTVIALSAGAIGYALNGWRLGLLSGGCFVWIALMGQWKWAMETLSVIIVAAPIAVFLGLALGIWAWRRAWVEKALNPILNVAQSLPHFSYMIPVVVFIGVGPKAGAIVTIIFATPPMIRMTLLGLQKVPPEIIESGLMCGATPWQMLRQVRIPTARSEILVGVNQVIMQCLAMVVLASFIGMPGLGQKLLQLLQALKIGRSVEIGITIVLLAIILDRCSKAFALRQPEHIDTSLPWWKRRAVLLVYLGLITLAFILAAIFPWFHEIKRSQAFTISKELDSVVDWLVIAIDPATQALRAFLITSVLIPLRDFYLWLPFTAVLLGLAALGKRIGGWRSATIALAYFGLIAASGWWDRAMITVYMVSFAVLLCVLIGLPMGIWAARAERRSRIMLLICDTAQTFPSFIYLIPVVMLFGVNDVAAIGAVIAYGSVPMTRYTIEGLRQVPVAQVEAADMCGATSWQALVHVRLPLALPTIMVGLNQTILFSLFMVIIAAFIGTQDLGQEMQRALSSTNVGKGLVLGLAVAFMGLLADHLIMRWASERRARLGLPT